MQLAPVKPLIFLSLGDLVYPNGGRYKATWVRGKATNGKYYFDDNLEYKANNWNYIIPEDRRFYAEIKGGFRPCGMALQTNKGQAEEIPYGTYNTGEVLLGLSGRLSAAGQKCFVLYFVCMRVGKSDLSVTPSGCGAWPSAAFQATATSTPPQNALPRSTARKS